MTTEQTRARIKQQAAELRAEIEAREQRRREAEGLWGDVIQDGPRLELVRRQHQIHEAECIKRKAPTDRWNRVKIFEVIKR